MSWAFLNPLQNKVALKFLFVDKSLTGLSQLTQLDRASVAVNVASVVQIQFDLSQQ